MGGAGDGKHKKKYGHPNNSWIWCVCFLFYPLVFCRLLGNILSVCVVLFLVPGNSVCMYLSGLIAVYVCSSILFLYCCA